MDVFESVKELTVASRFQCQGTIVALKVETEGHQPSIGNKPLRILLPAEPTIRYHRWVVYVSSSSGIR